MASLDDIRGEIHNLMSRIDQLTERQEKDIGSVKKRRPETIKKDEIELESLTARFKLLTRQYVRSIFGRLQNEG